VSACWHFFFHRSVSSEAGPHQSVQVRLW